MNEKTTDNQDQKAMKTAKQDKHKIIPLKQKKKGGGETLDASLDRS